MVKLSLLKAIFPSLARTRGGGSPKPSSTMREETGEPGNVQVMDYGLVASNGLVLYRVRGLRPDVVRFVIDHPGVFQLKSELPSDVVFEVVQLVKVREEVDGAGVNQVDGRRVIVSLDPDLVVGIVSQDRVLLEHQHPGYLKKQKVSNKKNPNTDHSMDT